MKIFQYFILQLVLIIFISVIGCGHSENKSPDIITGTGAQTSATSCNVYVLAQSISTYYDSKFGAISTTEEVDRIFEAVKGRINAVEFETLYYSHEDLNVHRKIAERAEAYGIERWATSLRLLERIRAFVDITPALQAYRMLEDGTIIPAEINERPLFDILNQEAMSIFLEAYGKKYLEPFKGLFNGYFFNEDVLMYFGAKENNHRFDYWNNPTYSSAVLNAWRDYCRTNNVTFDGKLVQSFPVHRSEMVAKGNGLTEYYPGYNVPEVIYSGESFSTLPRAEGVWRHWYEFITERFQKVWIDQTAALANKVNEDNPEWRGVIYFGLHHWSLPYEAIENSNFRVSQTHQWGAWGMQRGVDLVKMSASPHIKAIICETYPPVSANLSYYIGEFQRIAKKNGKIFGVMLHRDDNWKIDLNEEQFRWELINSYSPSILARYPLKSMLPWNENYSRSAEFIFEDSLKEYRKKDCPSFIQ